MFLHLSVSHSLNQREFIQNAIDRGIFILEYNGLGNLQPLLMGRHPTGQIPPRHKPLDNQKGLAS